MPQIKIYIKNEWKLIFLIIKLIYHKISLMKSTSKNGSSLIKKSMNMTAQIGDLSKGSKKKTVWKNKTSKLTKTMTGKTMGSNPTPMTEDDIDKLFGNYSKSKNKELGPTKVSTEVPQTWVPAQNKNFIHSVKFLKVDDEWDKLLTGLPFQHNDQDRINALFENDCESVDLTSKFKHNYMVGKVIGEGAYASVRIAIYKPLNRKIAIKVYEKAKIREIHRKKSIRRQIQILQLLNHPNIVKIYDVVETNNHLNIVMEYLPGTSLGSYLKVQPNLKIPEKYCKKIFKNITKALKYMHQMNIAHRDIKLENVILDEDLNPKLIDFGFSTCIQSSKKVKIFCGTPSYMAPEVVQRKQYKGQSADIWALGVLLFVSLTGIFPYKGATDQELYKKINNAEYPKNEVLPTKAAADLISKMFIIDADERITASQILNHSWLVDNNKGDSSKKKMTDASFDNRKRVNTLSSNHSKENKWGKTNKKVLAETCKQNLHLEIKKALYSPMNKKQIHSYRKTNNKIEKNDKQNTLKFLKSDKNSHRDNIKENNKEIRREKQKLGKTHSKVIDLLRVEIKKRQSENFTMQKSKSKSKPKRV